MNESLLERIPVLGFCIDERDLETLWKREGERKRVVEIIAVGECTENRKRESRLKKLFDGRRIKRGLSPFLFRVICHVGILTRQSQVSPDLNP